MFEITYIFGPDVRGDIRTAAMTYIAHATEFMDECHWQVEVADSGMWPTMSITTEGEEERLVWDEGQWRDEESSRMVRSAKAADYLTEAHRALVLYRDYSGAEIDEALDTVGELLQPSTEGNAYITPDNEALRNMLR